MGLLFSKIWQKLFKYNDFKIIIVGLNNAGKTTILYKLFLGEVVYTKPTIGSNVEEIRYKNIRFEMWDLGGQDSCRSSWSHYYVNTHAVMIVMDSTDRERLFIVKSELQRILASEDLANASILVFANKQDLKGAMSPAEITSVLGLDQIRDHSWHIQGCCALTGEGLFAGLDWIADHVRQ
mmetsp:Transcript_4574/g.7940  ORF Transcript_4574/g.7940 Transcript_4574/m.7940 type:complete len:180 (-) Transcript_4574:198-737(-)